jgi:hypothetical protein
MGNREKSVRLVPALILAVTAGYLFNSFSCGIITFLVAAYFAVRGWQLIFDGSLISMLRLIDELKPLLCKSQQTGFYSDRSSPDSRDWFINPGLRVISEENETLTELIAGSNKHYRDFDTTVDCSSGNFDCRVKIYKPENFLRYKLMKTHPNN